MENPIRLRWKNHQGTILSVFESFLSSQTYADVTLACEGQYIRAHKLILAACSPYFEVKIVANSYNMLVILIKGERLNCWHGFIAYFLFQELLDVDVTKHPIFFMKDVTYSELHALVNYMYRGEMEIMDEDLSSLLRVAQSLQIRGLTDVEMSSNSIASETIILRDPGNRNQRNPPSVPVTLPPLAPASSTSSVNTLRILHQRNSLVEMNSFSSAADAPILQSVAQSAGPPPPALTSTTGTRYRNIQLGDARIILHRLPEGVGQNGGTQNGTRYSDDGEAPSGSHANHKNGTGSGSEGAKSKINFINHGESS